MDGFDNGTGAEVAAAPRRGTRRGGRLDRSWQPPAPASGLQRPMLVTPTPLVPSHVLGPLLGLRRLDFKLEQCLLSGTWLDRGAARVLARDSCANRPLACVGGGAVSAALAVQCARLSRPLIVLLPEVEAATAGGWLAALGAHVVIVEADLSTLLEAAPTALRPAGARFIGIADEDMLSGLDEVRSELRDAGAGDALLVVPQLVGGEADWLDRTTTAGEMRLPLDGIAAPAGRALRAVVSTVGAPANDGVTEAGVVRLTVSARDAQAAQRLLAQDEGILVSLDTAAALAAGIQVVRADCQVPTRERRLSADLRMVLLTGRDPFGPAGSSRAVHGAPLQPVRLDDLPRVLASSRVHATRLHTHDATDDGT